MQAPYLHPDDYPKRIVRLERQVQALKFAMKALIVLALRLIANQPDHTDTKRQLKDALSSLDTITLPNQTS